MNKKKSIVGKQLMMICLILVVGLSMAIYSFLDHGNVSELPFTYEVDQLNSDKISVKFREGEHAVMILENYSKKPMYWEIFDGIKLEGDCLVSGTVEGKGKVEKELGVMEETGLYTFLLYNDGSTELKCTFRLEEKKKKDK